MVAFFLIPAMMLSAAATEVRVDVGRANWDALPQLEATDRRLPYETMVERVEQMLKSGECSVLGQQPERFDITVPYAVLVEPDGSASRVVVAESGCAPLESYVGRLVHERARLGDFKRSGADRTRWYASKINFTLQ
jgi:hypothetical protein